MRITEPPATSTTEENKQEATHFYRMAFFLAVYKPFSNRLWLTSMLRATGADGLSELCGFESPL
jgi:hypothetical protein